MSNGDVWLGIVPSGAMRLCAQTVVHFLEPLVWPNLCPRDCPNPKKFPCNVCKACFTLQLGGAFSTNCCKHLVVGVHRAWVQRCKHPACRPRRVATPITTTTPTPQAPSLVPPKQPRPRRKRKCSDREGLFIEVLNYTRRHKGCGLCSAKLPRLEECMCVNDSKHQFLVNLGRDVWGGDRCQLCVQKGYLTLPTEQGIT